MDSSSRLWMPSSVIISRHSSRPAGLICSKICAGLNWSTLWTSFTRLVRWNILLNPTLPSFRAFDNT